MWLSLIAAMSSPDRVIGAHNQLPWHLPADMHYFRKTTLNKPILMGRKTFTSIGKALPHRENIILTRDPLFNAPNVTVFHAWQEALFALQDKQEVFVIGGEEIFKQALPIAKYLYLTLIDAHFRGDTYFPAWEQKEWREISRTSRPADVENPYDLSFVILENSKAAKN